MPAKKEPVALGYLWANTWDRDCLHGIPTVTGGFRPFPTSKEACDDAEASLASVSGYIIHPVLDGRPS